MTRSNDLQQQPATLQSLESTILCSGEEPVKDFFQSFVTDVKVSAHLAFFAGSCLGMSRADRPSVS